jgi:hypothetical protein
MTVAGKLYFFTFGYEPDKKVTFKTLKSNCSFFFGTTARGGPWPLRFFATHSYPVPLSSNFAPKPSCVFLHSIFSSEYTLKSNTALKE